MRQKTIETGVCTLLFVEAPEGVLPKFERQMLSQELYLMHEGRMIWGQPLGRWEEICRVSGVTEGIAADIIHETIVLSPTGALIDRGYRNYEHFGIYDRTATESFHSLLRVNRIDWYFNRTYIFKLL